MNTYVDLDGLASDSELDHKTMEESHEILCRYIGPTTGHPVQETVEVAIDVDQLLAIEGNVGLQCVNCKRFNVTYRLLATRSGDEGMTAIHTCRDCKHHWKSQS